MLAPEGRLVVHRAKAGLAVDPWSRPWAGRCAFVVCMLACRSFGLALSRSLVRAFFNPTGQQKHAQVVVSNVYDTTKLLVHGIKKAVDFEKIASTTNAPSELLLNPQNRKLP